MDNLHKNINKLSESLLQKKFVITAETTPKTNTDLNENGATYIYAAFKIN